MDLIGLAERLYYVLHRRGDVIERLRPWFPLGVTFRTLDLGGGDGRVSLALAESSPGIFVVADLDAATLRLVPKALGPVVASGGRLPFRDRAFDRILLIDVLHEIGEGRELLLAELARTLRPRGELLAVDFDGRSLLTSLFAWLARRMGRPCRFFLRPGELRDVLARSGLVAHVESIDRLRFLACARAPHVRERVDVERVASGA